MTDGKGVDMGKRICSIEGCGKAHLARGWCSMHWQRWQKNGTPGDASPQREYGRSAEARFWGKIELGPTCPWLGTPCWLWTGFQPSDGYGRIHVGGRMVLAHRFSFELGWPMYQPWLDDSEFEIDHACRNRACVNYAHLHLVTNKQNQENRGTNRNNTSGVRGVSWCKRTNRWYGRVWDHGKTIRLGYFDTIAEAQAARIAAEDELFTNVWRGPAA